MRQIAGRNLGLGNAGDSRDTGKVLATGVEAVVEVAYGEPLMVLPRELVRLRFPLSDGGDNPAWLLRLATESVAALVRERVPVLVCCSAGLSRSVCVAAAGIALAEDRPLDETLVEVTANGTADVSLGLFEQFRQALGE